MGRLADRLRQMNTRKGLRPYRVFLRWTRWDAERGDGYETDVATVELLPTPKVASMDSVSFSLFHAGTVPAGSLRLSEVSAARYSEDNLRGLVIPTFPGHGEDEGASAGGDAPCDPPGTGAGISVRDGASVREPYQFFYEVVEDGRHGRAERKRFRILSEPMLRADTQQWTLMLEKTDPDQRRDGSSPFARPGPA
jgi:hypothetical protein